jgi:hypothetical protein
MLQDVIRRKIRERRVMSAPKFIYIDSKRLLWRELLRRREQVAGAAKLEKPVLFEMKKDSRPVSERTAAGLYAEPSIFGFSRAGRIGESVMLPTVI